MKCFLKLGQKVIFKALTTTMLLGAFMVFMGGWACAEEKSAMEQFLDIMLQSHQISQEQYNVLQKKAEAEKLAETQKILEAQKAAAPRAKNPTDFNAYWANGLRLTTEDKAFDIHIGGRIQADIADAEVNNALDKWVANSPKPPKVWKTDGYGDQMRRVRLDIDGTIWNNIEFITQIDFAPAMTTTYVQSYWTSVTGGTKQAIRPVTTGPAVGFDDVWIGVKDIPYVGRIKVGQMYEPLSIEQLTSDNWNTFMEKALPVNGLLPSRNLGIQVQNTTCNDRIGWMAGYFFQQQVGTYDNDVPQDATGDLWSPHLDATDVAVRVYALPWYENNGEHLLHVGIGYEHKFRSAEGDTTNAGQLNPGELDFKSSPEANMFSSNNA
jgi:phosphate-selective porin OprO/OprP